MTTQLANPLRAALAEFSRVDAHVWPVADVLAGPSHLPAGDVIHSGPAVRTLLEDAAQHLAIDDPTESAVVLAGHWAWLLTLPARAAWVIGRVVPDVHPMNVAFGIGTSGLPELALFTTGRYGCEASTPAARCADAVVFASACTLNQWWLGRVLDAHLEPLMKTLHGIANVPLDLLQRAVAEGFAAARDAVATTLDVSAPRLRDC